MNTHEGKSLTRRVFFGVLLFLALLLAAGPAAMGVVASGESVKGIVVETDAGLVIMAENDDYIVVGYDLSDMVGLTVKATGMVTVGTDGNQIHPTSVEQMR